MGQRWWIIALGVLCSAISLIYGHFARMDIFPSHYVLRADGDSLDQGHSRIYIENQASSLRAHWQFADGFAFPYVGINWLLEDDLGNCPDLSWTREVQLQFQGVSAQSFNLYLSEFLQSWSHPKDWRSYRPRTVRIWSADAASGKIHIPLHLFDVPDWWYVDRPDSPHQEEIELGQVCRMGMTFGGKSGDKDQIQIQSFVLVGDRRWVYLGWGLMLLTLCLASYWGWREFRQSKKQIRQLQARLDLQEKMKPVPKPEKDWPKIQAKIEELWNDTDLQMQTLVDQTGIPAHRITACIKESTGLNFKVLLNQIRLQKAEKLLLESDEQVAQIALKCGYGNVAHFYRVFKQAYGKNPGDFRAQSNSNPD